MTKPRPWILAVLAGATAPLLIAVWMILIWMESANAEIGHRAFDPSVLVSQFFLLDFALIGAFTYPCALLFLAIMAFAERKVVRPLWFWLLIGAAAVTPFAMVVWLVSHMGDCFDQCPPETSLTYFIPLFYVYGFAAAGTLIARYVRHGRLL